MNITHQTMRLIARATSRALQLGFIAALLGGGGVYAASAQQLFQAATSLDLRDAAAATAGVAADPLQLRQRLVRLNRNVLSQHVAPAGADAADNRAARAAQLDGVVQIELFPGTNLTFRRTSVTAADDSGIAWAGSASNTDIQEAMLIIDNGTVTGRIQVKNRLFKIEHVTKDVHRITEIDQLKIPREAPPRFRPGQPGGDPSAAQEDTPVGPQANTVIKVLVAYTVNARNQAGGTTNIVNQIKSAVALANQAYTRGQIPITVQLAGNPVQVSYFESSDISTDLDRLTDGSQFASLRNTRVSRKADLVSLFRRYDPTFCGIGWFPGNSTMPSPGAATRETGYSVMVRDCVSNLSFHHEMGHNMGLQHDRYVVGNVSNNYYNFGYINFPNRQRTVMAYNDYCIDHGTSCTRINWFSSPTIRATGNIVIGKAKGQPGAADNTLRLKQTRTAISNYYN